MIELILFFGVLLLFIVIDSHSIKFLAENFLPENHFTYEEIEGNLFSGLEVKNLRYQNKTLFRSAKLHWNPLTLISHEISVTEVEAQGVDLDNLLDTINTFASKKSEKKMAFNFAVSVKNLHLDINPYVYEGVTFSSFHFHAKEIKMDRSMNINTRLLFLAFNSDLFNAKINGRIKESILEIEEADIKEIDSKAITHFLQSVLKQQHREVNEKNVLKKKPVHLFKTIKIKHLRAILKEVDYKPLHLDYVKLSVSDIEIDLKKEFTYNARLMKLEGKSNFGKINFRGHIDKSTMITKGNILASKALFKRYSLPLNYKNLHKLPAKLRLSHDGVWLEIDHKVKKLLKIKSAFNLDVSKAKHKLHYDYHSLNLNIESQLKVNMPYGDRIDIKNKIFIDRFFKTTYNGSIKFKRLKNMPKVVTDYLLKDLNVKYVGNARGLKLKINSKKMTGFMKIPHYKYGTFFLKSKAYNLALNQLIPNPPLVFENEKMFLKTDGKLDFKYFGRSKINLSIGSKLFNLKSSIRHIETPYKISFNISIPPYSHLKRLNKNINFRVLKALQGEIVYRNNIINVYLENNKKLDFSFVYVPKSKILRDGRIRLGDEELLFGINHVGNLEVYSQIKDIEKLLFMIQQYYKIDLPPLKGSIDFHLKQLDNMNYLLDIQSPKIQYISTKNFEPSVLNIDKISMNMKFNKHGKLILNQYNFKVDNNEYIKRFYSIRQSFFKFKNGSLNINSFWINDKANLNGKYNFDNHKGILRLTSKGFPLKKKDFDLLFALNVGIALDAEQIALDGDITILGNTISYELEGSNIVEDADIVVLQDILKKKKNSLENLKLYLKIKNRDDSPLRYFSRDIQIEFYNELLVVKNYNSDILLTGMSTITTGFYRFEEKRFTLDESHLYFAGDPKKPLMDIKANYTKDQYVVHIFISGSPEEPIVNFNSDPYLSQQQILSLILFDGTGSGKGAEAYTLLGGTFAKGLIKSLGINVDHLLLGKDINDELSLEIGRRISKNVTVMYIHDEGQDGAKVQISHSPSFETDIIIQPPKHSSIEFLYKRDR